MQTLATLDRCGNAPCLDFVNTVHSWLEPQPREYLESYSDLLRWAVDEGVLPRVRARRLRRLAESRPDQAQRVLARARELRAAMHGLFAAVAAGRSPGAGDVAALNAALDRTLPRRLLRVSASGARWDWVGADEDLESLLWPVIVSASELLIDGDLARIKACPSPDGCGWLFLDTSKNGSRRWCSMKMCGGTVKARRYYRRKKAED